MTFADVSTSEVAQHCIARYLKNYMSLHMCYTVLVFLLFLFIAYSRFVIQGEVSLEVH
jgi:hypothetical protein